MTTQSSGNVSRIELLKTYLRTERYSASIQRRYLLLAQRFLDYLESKTLALESVCALDVEYFLRWELRNFRKRHGRAPRHFRQWRWRHTSAVHKLGCLLPGQWPVMAAPANAVEAFHRNVVQGFDTWLRDLRGLAPVTRSRLAKQAQQFLTALGPRGDQEGLTHLNIRDIDSYVQQRCMGLCRASIESCTVGLRGFLRYLHNSGRTSSDLGSAVIGPRIYDYEQIPSALRAEEVQKILEVSRQDLSPTGRRDYAFLMLLATYGLRAGEIVALRLEDIEWNKEVLRVWHSKTGAFSELPLLREPGEAVLSYLQEARPDSTRREIFLHLQAPYGAYTSGSILNHVIRVRLSAAGIVPQSRKGPHAFRHARAVSLLRAGVPLKSIGDVLGHTSARSTAVYLKLGTESLRSVALDLPKEVLL
ncbi:MAG: integrase [Acidobacteria bacterium]|nr:MAG: integrase [Acidobacteriota bacterium]